ncbi:MAG: hypothetical protein JKY49_06700 [Cohaesibacteraceae bacterium]|nr:hypothetical protein [Cohaesibacteraceae bacterium]MBL4877053.1 hypothetical protein [Cohaesibacteraceae bacterium]
MKNYQDKINEDVRLVILRALYDQTDYKLNSAMIGLVLEGFGHTCSRDYIHNQLNWLSCDTGAIVVEEISSVRIAKLTSIGRDHVERRRVLPGVERPSPED